MDKETEWKCLFCTKTYNTKSMWIVHIRLRHKLKRDKRNGDNDSFIPVNKG